MICRIQAPEAKCVSGNRISEPHCSHGCLGQNGVFSVISSHPQSGTDVDNNTCIPRLSDASEDSAAILREKYSPSAGTKELPSIAKRELCLPDSGMDDTVYIANTKIPVDGWIQACRQVFYTNLDCISIFSPDLASTALAELRLQNLQVLCCNRRCSCWTSATVEISAKVVSICHR